MSLAVSRFSWPKVLSEGRPLVLAASGAVCIGITVLWRSLSARVKPRGNVVPSPRKILLENLSAAETETLPYPSDSLPGARDVETPYGSIRVCEWGPRTGRKVLFLHGITTPCVSLASVASRLAEQNCRVMLFGMY